MAAWLGQRTAPAWAGIWAVGLVVVERAERMGGRPGASTKPSNTIGTHCNAATHYNHATAKPNSVA
nr:hypothetical protein [Mycobacteroides abscessus]